MSKPSTPSAITLERVFDAPRDRVFASFTEAEQLGAWFAPEGFDVLECASTPRVGGAWRVVYRSPAGQTYVEHGVFLALTAPTHMRMTLVNEDGEGKVAFRTEIDLQFEERAGKTTLRFHQTGFASDELRDGVKAGWATCFDRLANDLGAQREIRALFDAWFAASERKDLDASMEPIADDIVSYEHETPLAYRGVEGLRAQCKSGFDKAPDDFRWEVPDLHILVRGDIAVTWGKNHMFGPGSALWSRGTRIFQKREGRWQMIHQHVSFPMDPTTGASVMTGDV